MRLNSLDKYKNALFNRGFLISNVEKRAIDSSGVGENLQRYEKTYFGPYHFWYDKKLNYRVTRDNKVGVGVLGLVLNPFDLLDDNLAISDVLFRKLYESEDEFFDYVDQLTGSFVIVFRINDKVRILQDACATKQVFYYRSDTGNLTISSHVGIVAAIHSLSKNLDAAGIFREESYKTDPSRYLPGMLTAYNNVLPLTANNLLDCRSGDVVRFFPRSPLINRKLDQTVIRELARILRIQSLLLTRKKKTVIAITAGKDSRLTLATFRGLYQNSFSFTFVNGETGKFQKDADIGKKLAEIKSFEHRTYYINKYSSEEFAKVFPKHSPLGIWPSAAQLYIDEFDEDVVHVRSTISEIGRCFYGASENSNFDAARLAGLYTKSKFGKDIRLTAIFDQFIQKANFKPKLLFNYPFLDMFYWEHRNSKWQNVLCSEAEMASDVFIPFNNREILKLFLSVPVKERLAANLHLELIKYMQPEFATVPIDSNV